MNPLTLEETRLKEEMKSHCLAKGQYVDENAKAKFDMLCHLEDFEVQYWKLQEENKKLNGAIQTYDILLKANAEENKQLKDNWNKLREWLEKELGDRINPNKDKWLTGVYDAYRETIDKMQELEQGSDSNE